MKVADHEPSYDQITGFTVKTTRGTNREWRTVVMAEGPLGTYTYHAYWQGEIPKELGHIIGAAQRR